MSTPKGLQFKKNLPLLNNAASVGFEFAGGLASDVAAALASETAPFPNRDIDLAEVKLKASNEAKPIEFSRGADKISFTASGGIFAGMGVYHTGAAALAKLGDDDDFSLTGLEFGLDSRSQLAVMRWGYSASAKATGAMALAAAGLASLSFGGNKEGLYAVIRRVPVAMAARAVVQEAADSWIMPRQITSIDQVATGTWILADTIGGLSLSLSAQLGYNFNWVREAKLGTLTGDIGLLLNMGLNASVGYSSSGRCAIVISRESDAKQLRLRLFKLKSRELDVALNAALDIQAKDTLLPDKIDAFISAVFDTHGQQILSDLQVLEKWTDPTTPLTTLLADVGIDGAEKLIANLAGVTPETLQAEFDKVHATTVSFIQKWNSLPNKVSSTILKFVEDKVDLAPVRAVASRLAGATPQSLQALMDEQLNRLDFFSTPEGKFLESLADKGILSLPQQPLADVKAAASKVLAVLDGSFVEEQLTRFQRYIQNSLHLNRVMETVTQTDFDALDALLKKKLANFLGQDTVLFADLEKIRKSISTLLGKRQEYYTKALDALHRKYSFDLAAAYQATTTDQALFDATFDFSQDSASVGAFLQQAVNGDLDKLLTTHHKQVKIAAARISHGTTRQTVVDVTLPFLTFSERHINESLAAVQAVPNEGGLLFTLNSSDTVASNHRQSVLSMSVNLAGDTGIRLHDDAVETNYTMLYARQNMNIGQVRDHVGGLLRICSHFLPKEERSSFGRRD